MNNRKMIIVLILFSLTVAVYSQTAADFEVNGTVLVRYRGTERNVSIPASLGITEIGSRAFSSSITSVTIPASVMSIREDAFLGSSLSSINVNNRNTVYSSTDGVLFNKDNTILILYPRGKQGQNYTIPRGVKEIGSNAFSFCRSLTSITLPAGLTTIGDSAFFSCTGLTSIALPAGLTTIGDSAFYGCESLTSITLPAGLIIIGDSAFYDCERLTTITIPASVTSIGDRAFSGLSSLTSINVHNENTAYSSTDGVLFNKSRTLLIKYPEAKQDRTYIIPMGVIVIERMSFYNNRLYNIIIPNSVTHIGLNAFSGDNLTNITIPHSVTYIEAGGFSGHDLSRISIGENVDLEIIEWNPGTWLRFISAYWDNGRKAGTYYLHVEGEINEWRLE